MLCQPTPGAQQQEVLLGASCCDCRSLHPKFGITFSSYVCVCVMHESWGGQAMRCVRQTILSENSVEQVYLWGGSQRAFPRSLIRDSDSVEEVRGRGSEGGWWRRRARTGCIAIWQGERRDGGTGSPGIIRCSASLTTAGETFVFWRPSRRSGELGGGGWVGVAKARRLAFTTSHFFYLCSLLVISPLRHLTRSPSARCLCFDSLCFDGFILPP